MAFVVISGAVAAGKSTMARNISNANTWQLQEETVEGHPCLPEFYRALENYQKYPEIQTHKIEAHYYSFVTQMFFLVDRWDKHNDACIQSAKTHHVVADRSIYEDDIFARMLVNRGEMSERFYHTVYKKMQRILCGFLREPDVVVFLRASTDTLMKRKAARDRTIECSIPFDYMDQLNKEYDKWFLTFSQNPRVRCIECNAEDEDYADVLSNRFQMLLNKLDAAIQYAL